MKSRPKRNQTSVQKIAPYKQALEKQKQSKAANSTTRSLSESSEESPRAHDTGITEPDSTLVDVCSYAAPIKHVGSFRLDVVTTAADNQNRISTAFGRERVSSDTEDRSSPSQHLSKKHIPSRQTEPMYKMADKENENQSDREGDRFSNYTHP